MLKSILNTFLIFLILLFLMPSCVSRKELNYLQEIDMYDQKAKFENVRTEKKIDLYDKVYIKVYNLDPNVTELFQEQGSFTNNTNLISYTVNDKGYIDFPFVGKIKLEGLTIEEAKLKLEEEMNKFIPNTSIILKYVGNFITVMGEVNRQGEYPFYDDKINIFQALSYAGGISTYGSKSNVSIIREINNEISIHHIDLSKKNIVESPFYYLNPNDIIIVAPINARYRTYRDFALISMISTGISTAFLLYNFITNL